MQWRRPQLHLHTSLQQSKYQNIQRDARNLCVSGLVSEWVTKFSAKDPASKFTAGLSFSFSQCFFFFTFFSIFVFNFMSILLKYNKDINFFQLFSSIFFHILSCQCWRPPILFRPDFNSARSAQGSSGQRVMVHLHGNAATCFNVWHKYHPAQCY